MKHSKMSVGWYVDEVESLALDFPQSVSRLLDLPPKFSVEDLKEAARADYLSDEPVWLDLFEPEFN